MLLCDVEDCIARERVCRRRQILLQRFGAGVVAEKTSAECSYPYIVAFGVFEQRVHVASRHLEFVGRCDGAAGNVVVVDSAIFGSNHEVALWIFYYFSHSLAAECVVVVSGLNPIELLVLVQQQIDAAEVGAYPHIVAAVAHNGIDSVVVEVGLVDVVLAKNIHGAVGVDNRQSLFGSEPHASGVVLGDDAHSAVADYGLVVDNLLAGGEAHSHHALTITANPQIALRVEPQGDNAVVALQKVAEQVLAELGGFREVTLIVENGVIRR